MAVRTRSVNVIALLFINSVVILVRGFIEGKTPLRETGTNPADEMKAGHTESAGVAFQKRMSRESAELLTKLHRRFTSPSRRAFILGADEFPIRRFSDRDYSGVGIRCTHHGTRRQWPVDAHRLTISTMHCMDDDYSVLTILPPYNTVNSQLINAQGK